MPLISFDLTTGHTTRLIDAFCGLHNYDHFSKETGETRQQFATRKLREFLVSQVRRWEGSEAQKAARATLTDINVG